PAGQMPGPVHLGFAKPELPYTQREKRVDYRRTRPSGAELHNRIEIDPGEAFAEALGEAPTVGVVTDPSSTGKDHGVDGSDRCRLGSEVIEQLHDRLFEREGDVDSGKAEFLDDLKHRRQIGVGEAESVEIAQDVGVSEADAPAL